MAELSIPPNFTTRLQELTNRHPELAQAVAYYQQRSIEFEKVQDRIHELNFSPSTFKEKLEAKQVLFQEEDLPFSSDVMQDLFTGLCLASNAKDILNLVHESSLNVDELIQLAINQETEGIHRLGILHKIDPILLAMLAQDCLKPALMTWVRQIQPTVDLSAWQNPVCPFCGSYPGLAEIQGTRGECHLRCTRCGADWLYRQMACGLCGNDDYNSLGILSIEGENNKYRVKTCDACNGYLKTIVTFEPIPAAYLAFEDLITLHLDIITQDRGYQTIPNRKEFAS